MSMKDGRCPKCKSTEVFTDNGKLGGYRNFMLIGRGKGLEMENLVCVSCGYAESYVSMKKQDLLKLLAEKWTRPLDSSK